jgi:serine acetyltransferase
MFFKILFKLQLLCKSFIISSYYRLLPRVYFRKLGRSILFRGRVTVFYYGTDIRIGDKCNLGQNIFFSATNKSSIVLCNGVSCNTGCHIVSMYGIEIGDNTSIGEYVSIRDQNHEFKNGLTSIRNTGYSGAPIHIGKDVWIGRGCFIGPGVSIGDGAVIGANSVVIKNIPSYSVAVGTPAKVIKNRLNVN